MAQPTRITGTITTPWRVVVAGRDLNSLVNADIIHNVELPRAAEPEMEPWQQSRPRDLKVRLWLGRGGAAVIREFLDDAIDSLRDTIALVLFTVFVAWLYAPEGVLA